MYLVFKVGGERAVQRADRPPVLPVNADSPGPRIHHGLNGDDHPRLEDGGAPPDEVVRDLGGLVHLLAAAMPAWLYGQAETADCIEPPQGMHLVWHDEFDYAGRPDSSKWDFEHGFVRNQELQWYQPQNAVVADGVLRISALKEQVANPRYRAGSNNWKHNREYAEYTSSCLRTMRHFTYKYGRLEVRAKIPVAPGAWPAIWTLANRHG